MRYGLMVAAGLAMSAAPALAQHAEHGQQAAGHQGDMMQHMVCEMGMLPHPGMHGAMQGMMGQGMQHGAMGERPSPQGQPAQPAQPAQPGQPAQPAQPGQPAQPAQPAQPGMHQGMQHGQAGAAGQRAMMQGMMGAMDHTRTAHMLQEHGDEMGLALTAEQKAKMGQLAEAASAACATHYGAAKTAHGEALRALESGDLDEYEDKLEDALEHMVQAHVPVIRSGLDAKALLTEEQRGKLGAKAEHKHQ